MGPDSSCPAYRFRETTDGNDYRDRLRSFEAQSSVDEGESAEDDDKGDPSAERGDVAVDVKFWVESVGRDLSSAAAGLRGISPADMLATLQLQRND